MQLPFEAVSRRIPESTTELTWKCVGYMGSDLWISRDLVYIGQTMITTYHKKNNHLASSI